MIVPMDKWQRAQELEADYHREDGWRKSPAFMEDTGRLFEFLGFERWQFNGERIIDIGGGSRIRTAWFDNVYMHHVIEPMKVELLELGCSNVCFQQPAEELVSSWRGEMAAVFCINVLDHCYDPAKVVENCIAYLAPGGTLCLSVDIKERADEMHPALFTEADVDGWLQGVTVERKLRGIPGSKSYGGGEAVTWICKK